LCQFICPHSHAFPFPPQFPHTHRLGLLIPTTPGFLHPTLPLPLDSVPLLHALQLDHVLPFDTPVTYTHTPCCVVVYTFFFIVVVVVVVDSLFPLIVMMMIEYYCYLFYTFKHCYIFISVFIPVAFIVYYLVYILLYYYSIMILRYIISSGYRTVCYVPFHLFDSHTPRRCYPTAYHASSHPVTHITHYTFLVIFPYGYTTTFTLRLDVVDFDFVYYTFVVHVAFLRSPRSAPAFCFAFLRFRLRLVVTYAFTFRFTFTAYLARSVPVYTA